MVHNHMEGYLLEESSILSEDTNDQIAFSKMGRWTEHNVDLHFVFGEKTQWRNESLLTVLLHGFFNNRLWVLLGLNSREIPRSNEE